MVKKIDCCKDINTKATIIINDNTTSATAAATPANASFNFELTSSVNTSAGVYNTDGNLVRTLWGGVRYDAGCYLGQWDGLLDDGTQAPFGNYTVKVLTNNVQYTWGVVGNTSTDNTGDYVVKRPFMDLAFTGTTGYAAGGYSEGISQQRQFDVSNPNKWTSGYYKKTTQATYRVCTDGNIIYWAGRYPLADNTNHDVMNHFIYGAYPADNCNPDAAMVNFANGVTINGTNGASGPIYYASALANTTNANGFITDLDVQRSGKFLFVVRTGLNQLLVLDKRPSSGAVLQTLTYSGITAARCDDSNHLYFIYNNTVHKATINAEGTLTDLNVNFTGLQTPRKLAVSFDGTKLIVGDIATNQVLVYGNTGGAPTKIIGQSGGNYVTPLIANDRFSTIDFVRFQPDGKFWVGDSGYSDGQESSQDNSRCVRFNTDGSYDTQVQSIFSSRNSNIDPNNADRVFADNLEFRPDNAKPLDSNGNPNWKFYANWGKKLPYLEQRFKQVFTAYNNRTYFTVDNQLYELNEATGLRPTGVSIIYDLNNNNKLQTLGKDGSLWTVELVNGNYGNAKISYQELSFDTNNNPVWGALVPFCTTPANNNPYYQPGSAANATVGFTKDTQKYIWFDVGSHSESYEQNPVVDYHLGATLKGQSSYQWQAQRGTALDYLGDIPLNGDWDIGNGYPNQHSLTHAMVSDNLIFVPQNNEFWKSTYGGGYENNIINVFKDNGLFLTQIGITGTRANMLGNCAAEWAGNNFGSGLSKTADGNYSITVSDESGHGAAGIFYVKGANTIQETSFPITLKGVITAPVDNADKMAGVPFRSAGFYGGYGWTMKPAAFDNHSYPQYGTTYPDWQVTTSVRTYTKDNIDLAWISDDNANGTIIRDLGTNNTNNWVLSAAVTQGNYHNDKTSFDILDAAGKVIVTFHSNYSGYEVVNGSNYVSGAYDVYTESFQFNTFKISNTGGVLSFSYAGQPPLNIGLSDHSANVLTPKSFRITTSGAGDGSHSIGSLKGLKFTSSP